MIINQERSEYETPQSFAGFVANHPYLMTLGKQIMSTHLIQTANYVVRIAVAMLHAETEKPNDPRAILGGGVKL